MNLSPSEKSTGYKRFYIKGTIGTQDKRYLSVLRQKTLLHIVVFLLKNQTVQHKDILENVAVSPSTLSYHLNKLVKHDIVEVQRYGEHKGYQLKNREEIITWLIQYKPFDLYEEFTNVWSDIIHLTFLLNFKAYIRNIDEVFTSYFSV